MTPELLAKMFPAATLGRVAAFAEPLTVAMGRWQIATPARQAAFLAQIGHESGSLVYVEEIASGDAYDTRTDLGNTPERDGDGRRYKGRGLLQITGRNNYRDCGVALGVDLTADPDLLETPRLAAQSAGWFWFTHGCNELADRNRFGAITRAINGGYNGLDERIGHWIRIRELLGL